MSLPARVLAAAIAFSPLSALADPPGETPAAVIAPRAANPDELAVGASAYLLPVPAAMRLADTFHSTGSWPVVPMATVMFAHASTAHRSLELRLDTIGLASRVEGGVRWRLLDRAVAPYFALRAGPSLLLPPLTSAPDVGFSFSIAAGVETLLPSRFQADLEIEVGGFGGVPVAGVTLVVGRRGHA